MSRIVMVKITYPKGCGKCGRIIQVNEWAQAHAGGQLACGSCTGSEADAA